MAAAFRHVVAGLACAAACVATAAGTTDDDIAALVRQLGDPDYGRREMAATRLESIGAPAIDQLLAAAERSGDLEVSLRANWLIETIPLDDPADTADAKALLEGYKTKSLAEQNVVMHRLLRLDDDAGIVPLARIIRLGRDPVAARIATALLVREWSPGDAYWPGMAERITAGLGSSARPCARLLTAVVAFSRAPSSADRIAAIAMARDVIASLDRQRRVDAAGVDDGEEEDGGAAITRDVGATTRQIFERCLARMLAEAGQRDEAVAILRTALDDAFEHGADETRTIAAVADALVWAASHDLPEVVDGMQAHRADGSAANPVVRYAMALCERSRQQETEAERLARAAFEASNGEPVGRLRSAILLVKWGAGDWACREYEAIVNDNESPAPQVVLASIMYSEFLHDRGRDGEAARVLRVLHAGDQGARNPILQQMGRDQDTLAARMHYFEACAAAARGDAEAEREALERATSKPRAKDIDALIALYRLSADNPDRKAVAVARIHDALRQMEERIKQMPEETNTYNEYAWLVANTEGDFAKALRYSKQSLRESFDNASYLDTLAHCRAAAGDVPSAIRTQRLAMRHEPHNRMIRLNLERFERQVATATAE